MLALTKYSCRQNTGVDKILASTKYSHRQNVGVAKIYALTKYSHQQNPRVDKILAHAWKHLLSVWPGRVHSSWLLPDLADVLLRIPEGVDPSTCSHQVCRCHWPPCFYGRTLSRTVVPARHAENVTNIGIDKYWRPPRFHWFLPNYLLTGVLLKIGENKKWSPWLSNISSHTHKFQNRGHHRDPMLRSLYTPKG